MHPGVIRGWHMQCVKERSSCAHVELRQVMLGVHSARGAAGSKEPQDLGPSLLLVCFGTRDKSRACATGAERIPSQHQKFPPWKVATGRDGVGEAACALLAGRELGNAWSGVSNSFCCPYNLFFWKPSLSTERTKGSKQADCKAWKSQSWKPAQGAPGLLCSPAPRPRCLGNRCLPKQ